MGADLESYLRRQTLEVPCLSRTLRALEVLCEQEKRLY